MKLTKLNFVGEAAESKEFRNAQLVKGAKVRYGSYDMEVPIGRYNELNRNYTCIIHQSVHWRRCKDRYRSPER